MSTPSGSSRPDGSDAGTSGPTDPDAIKAEIEATREQLGRTVDELSHRLDVPARAKEGAARAKDTAVETYRESPPAVIGAGAALAGLVGLLAWRRRRKRRRRASEVSGAEPQEGTFRGTLRRVAEALDGLHRREAAWALVPAQVVSGRRRGQPAFRASQIGHESSFPLPLDEP